MPTHAALNCRLTDLDVVLVEDSKPMLTLLRSMLQGLRVARVRSFDGAEAALQAMLTEAPNLLITDHKMSPMTGHQLLRAIRDRRMEPLCFIPVMIVTAHATHDLVEKVLEAGAHQVVAKPVAPSDLARRIEMVLKDTRQLVLAADGERYVIQGVAQRLADRADQMEALRRARAFHTAMSSGGEEQQAAQEAGPRALPGPPAQRALPAPQAIRGASFAEINYQAPAPGSRQ